MNSKNSMTLELLWILIVLLYFATLYAPSTFAFTLEIIQLLLFVSVLFLSVINLCRALKCRNGEWWKPAASLGICLCVIVSHFVEPDIVHYINKSFIIR